ncbi:hypothetical protein B0T26DRAFT_750228 [Lasiosphaeria miniovina]|uniref:Uncharacterized protein n=1 Tax=Lasiosphaeria miniovina TaxID=1954250 RepID=A0AA40E015_9PEZI|nr:uncharacterized protein B0T26DRAFT_750228 [Lasiosphaeria miniovina]KAK0722884.1 hypothetical protein B0T26DRAFT_750228 [Lasiosphaeria miniovina]
MDRPEPGLIKWSPNAAHDSFLHINLQHRIVEIYEPTGRARRGRFDYKKVAKHDDLPPLTTYDWSPSVLGLVAVGTSTGVVNLLRVDDSSNAYLELGLKISRTCHAVAFNTRGQLAVALDRVRSDNCLYVWDVNRLSTIDSAIRGFPSDIESFSHPSERLEPSVSVSSVKFFEDNPNVLVAGIKSQGLRIHDLRDQAHGAVIQFPTKCCNNLAIDYADQNYFASSALDQPGVMVWDRRAIHRHDTSPAYTDALDKDGLPWGGALRLNQAVEMEADPDSADSKSSCIRSLRFCRDHAGMLAVLSRTGQLRILSTRHEPKDDEPDSKPTDAKEDPAPIPIPVQNVPTHVGDGPELLEIRRSYELDPLHADPSHKMDKIVSFDWITLSSPVPQPRLLVLRANGALDVLEKPSFTSEYPFNLNSWKLSYRGLEAGASYHAPMLFEPAYSHRIYGPLLTEKALADVPLFGPNKADIGDLVEEALASSITEEDLQPGEAARNANLPAAFIQAASVAEKLGALRLTSREGSQNPDISEDPPSQLERREQLLTEIVDMSLLSNQAQATIDHTMLLRAKEGYRFNCEKNQQIVADDPWVRDVWAWISGAEEAASDGGMMSHPLDLSWMGVYTIWINDLGSKSYARLSDHASAPGAAGWERCLNSINKKLGIPKFDGVETKRPHHREICLEICNWGRSYDSEFEQANSVSSLKRDSTWYTMVAAHAMFRGNTKEAVQVLKRGSSEHQSLLFVSLALQLIGKNGNKDAKEALDFDEKVASKTDPYLRAISSIIATGDWATIVNQRSLPMRDRAFVAIRTLPDEELTAWLEDEVFDLIITGNIEGIILTGITDPLVDIFARYVQKFRDFQTATLVLSYCAPRFIDDIRATAFRNAYRNYLQRHRAAYPRAKFDVESTRLSKHNGRPTVEPPPRQFVIRCYFCEEDVKTTYSSGDTSPISSTVTLSSFMLGGGSGAASAVREAQQTNPFVSKMVSAGISCPNCKRHFPRCVVCLEVVTMPRSDRPELARNADTRVASRFPTFCITCRHAMHLDHARQWFARHEECPVPECKCVCNFQVTPDLQY